MAADLWRTLVALVGFLILMGGVIDFALYLDGRETISEHLNKNPALFWWPVGILLAFLAVLAFHLFVLPPEWGGT